jgi:TrkA domain protein
MEIIESDLPGIGKKFVVNLEEGGTVTIVIHHDGNRELYYQKDDQSFVFTMNDEEARTISSILAGAYFRPKHVEDSKYPMGGDIFVTWIKVKKSITLGELKATEKTGCYVAAVIRNGDLIPLNPELLLEEGDTLVVVGNSKSIEELRKMLS